LIDRVEGLEYVFADEFAVTDHVESDGALLAVVLGGSDYVLDNALLVLVFDENIVVLADSVEL
jgi:hypothetical protein